MSLFNFGNFILHSGGQSNFKIDCNALTNNDWAALAQLTAQSYNFCAVYGVPTGGEKFAKALEKHIDKNAETVLIVDDVLTTGNSMDEMREKVKESHPNSRIQGVVVFGTRRTTWVRPMFKIRVPR